MVGFLLKVEIPRLNVRNKYKKRENQIDSLFRLGYPDSNQERQDQNLQCYHYTIAQSGVQPPRLRVQSYGFFLKLPSFSPKKYKLFAFSRNSHYLCAQLNAIGIGFICNSRMKKQTDELVDAIVKGIQDKKGRRIVVADLTHIPDTICQQFVICSGGSPVQVQAVAHSVGDVTRETLGIKPLAVDGLRYARWVAMDYAQVIVHIFLPDERDFYDVEHLWADAGLTEIPDED